MALLTVVQTSFSGVAPSYSAVSASDTFANTGEEVLHVKNGGGSETTVTITSAQQCNQGFSHDLTVTIDAGANKFIGPFPTNRFNNSNGLTTFSCSSTTSVTAAVMRIRG